MSLPIALDEIERAYAELGIKPVSGTWADYYSDGTYDARKCACGLSAVVALRHGFDDAASLNEIDYYTEGHYSAEQEVSKLLGLTPAQVASFVRGFDHGEEWRDDSRFDKEAFDLGVAARERMSPVEYETLSQA